mmetsp:Transcript_33552/g.132339  ORF Transcript_33552/g.132339 Transcript_33552/m.132339 type:complete len:407 (-) Transcript_33552:3071-4291(-)|eukprot:CAMPEP_0113967970 /NCGR_PEP_ID=MMETSP0011_2-20120614/9242_1 /TAXON_ID=101924 /ORGANISM="Rhodosorus marinus" /LENGTH=406 /DNA_ID=CAMNT_0000980945 /DNA_START=375 /DNA_END=1595 /DNA_ORIENTATION=- /assembly_acc=CAM_ASM_000156
MGQKKLKLSPVLLDKYDVDESVLGNGSRGSVVHGLRKSDGREVAVKIVCKRELNEWAQTAVAREVHVLKTVQHENIVEFVDALEDQRYVYMILEYLRGGDLFTRLQKETAVLSEKTVLTWGYQILEALQKLHENGIAHRDIKLENFVFATSKDEDQQILKMVDFGLAFWRRPGSSMTASIPCGTVQYCSPEIAAQHKYVPEQADMWGVGIVLYALLARKLPFYDQSRSGTIAKIKQCKLSFEGERWKSVSPGTISLISKLLSKRGADRPSASEALGMVEECLSVAPLSDIEDDESVESRSMEPPAHPRIPVEPVPSRQCHGMHSSSGSDISPDPSSNSHKRQRSSSDPFTSLLSGFLMARKRREQETDVESLSACDDVDDEEDVEEGDEQELPGFVDGLCEAYTCI